MQIESGYRHQDFAPQEENANRLLLFVDWAVCHL